MKKSIVAIAAMLLCATAAQAQTATSYLSTGATPYHASILGGWSSHPGLTFGASRPGVDDGFNLGARAGVQMDTILPGLSADLDYFYNTGYFQTPASGTRLNSHSVMADLIYTMPVQDRWNVYGGAGVGLVHTNLSGNAHGGSSVLGWQALGGLEYAMNDQTSLFAEYRYQNAHNVNIPLVGQVGNTSNNVSTGVKFKF